MVNPVGNSILAAQIYSSATQVGSANQSTARGAKHFDETLETQRPAARSAKPAARAFPADRVEVPAAIEAQTSLQSVEQRFTREAPNASAERRDVAPGTYLDIRV